MIKVHRKASARTKLSSLYVFDAICRYAAQIVRKSASGFDHRRAEAPHGSRSERGSKEALTDSASSFLRSASDVLMEIATSTMATVREDQQVNAAIGAMSRADSADTIRFLYFVQAKVVKVVDIWIKASTFDQQVLKRVKSALDGPANQGQYQLYFYPFARTEIGIPCLFSSPLFHRMLLMLHQVPSRQKERRSEKAIRFPVHMACS